MLTNKLENMYIFSPFSVPLISKRSSYLKDKKVCWRDRGRRREKFLLSAHKNIKTASKIPGKILYKSFLSRCWL